MPTTRMIAALQREFEHESATTRTHLSRLPADQLDWRPHEKSFTTLALAIHIVDCVRWGDAIFSQDELDFNPATFKSFEATSVAEVIDGFDDGVTRCVRAMAGVDDEALLQPWRFTMRGRVRFEKARMDVFRDFTLSHLIHHRGQFSLYLRLLNVPVPGSYGPTADERF